MKYVYHKMETELTPKQQTILVFVEFICIYFTIKYFHYYRKTFGWLITLYIMLNDEIKLHFKIYILLWIFMNLFNYKKK